MPQPLTGCVVLPCSLDKKKLQFDVSTISQPKWVLGLINQHNQLSSLANKKSGTWKNSGPAAEHWNIGFFNLQGICDWIGSELVFRDRIWEPWESDRGLERDPWGELSVCLGLSISENQPWHETGLVAKRGLSFERYAKKYSWWFSFFRSKYGTSKFRYFRHVMNLTFPIKLIMEP